MKLKFLGTRGYIKSSSRLHRMHSSLLVSYLGKRVMVDCGETWLGKVDEVAPDAIVLTHAHPDHAFGLMEGAPCPVYATSETWKNSELDGFPLQDRRTITPGEPETVSGMVFQAFPLLHSTRSPAVGYRITAGRPSVFYAPDVVYIKDRKEALRDVKLYIGDGATISRSMVRKPGDTPIGHVPVRTQLTWCGSEGVPEMMVTHCGSEIVRGDERKLGPKLDRMAEERGVEVRIAHDGMERVLR